jgi:hypothetical protein
MFSPGSVAGGKNESFYHDKSEDSDLFLCFEEATIMSDILLVLLAIGAVLWLRKGKKSKEIKKEKAGDFIQIQSLDPDGFITTEDQRYMMILEVQPVSFALKSPMEQTAIWSAFRDWVNMMTHPVRLRAESHPYDLHEYFQELKAQAIETGGDLEYIQEMRETFLNALEEQQVRDRRYFLFLETDHRYLSEAGAGISNPYLNDLLRRSSTVNDNPEIAKQELTNSLRVTQSILHNVGIWTQPLNGDGVKSYLYGSANRDMASLVSWAELQENVNPLNEKVQSLGKIQYGQREGTA